MYTENSAYRWAAGVTRTCTVPPWQDVTTIAARHVAYTLSCPDTLLQCLCVCATLQGAAPTVELSGRGSANSRIPTSGSETPLMDETPRADHPRRGLLSTLSASTIMGLEDATVRSGGWACARALPTRDRRSAFDYTI